MDFDACIVRPSEKGVRDAYVFTRQIAEESRGSDARHPRFDRLAGLLRHKNSLVRSRAAASARWDRKGLLDAPPSHVTDTARQRVAPPQHIEE